MSVFRAGYRLAWAVARLVVVILFVIAGTILVVVGGASLALMLLGVIS